MWVWSEDRTAMVNLDHCLLLIIHKSDVGYGIMAHTTRGDMGTLLKVVDTEREAEQFLEGLGASANGTGGTLRRMH